MGSMAAMRAALAWQLSRAVLSSRRACGPHTPLAARLHHPVARRPGAAHRWRISLRALLPRRRRGTAAPWHRRWLRDLGRAAPGYCPRAPERGALNTVVRAHLDSFLRDV